YTGYEMSLHDALPIFSDSRASTTTRTSAGREVMISATRSTSPGSVIPNSSPSAEVTPWSAEATLTVFSATLRIAWRLMPDFFFRSEEHTSELQSRFDL